MNDHSTSGRWIDYAVVQRYFQAVGSNAAATASYMAHEQNLPENSVRYRLRKEIATVADWLDVVSRTSRVLDLGCGARELGQRYLRIGMIVSLGSNKAHQWWRQRGRS